jgi:hypothetical protein
VVVVSATPAPRPVRVIRVIDVIDVGGAGGHERPAYGALSFFRGSVSAFGRRRLRPRR